MEDLPPYSADAGEGEQALESMETDDVRPYSLVSVGPTWDFRHADEPAELADDMSTKAAFSSNGGSVDGKSAGGLSPPGDGRWGTPEGVAGGEDVPMHLDEPGLPHYDTDEDAVPVTEIYHDDASEHPTPFPMD